MEPKIEVGQSTITVHYKLVWPDGEKYAFFAEPVTPDVADVYGTINSDYTFVGITYPERKCYPFLSGTRIPQEVIQEKLDIGIRLASLLYAILPKLTLIAPADDIVKLATEWKTSNPYVSF
jgi:hypothetical protein